MLAGVAYQSVFGALMPAISISSLMSSTYLSQSETVALKLNSFFLNGSAFIDEYLGVICERN